MDANFNFVEDIDWEQLARTHGKTLMPDVSIGYSGGDFWNRFGARTTDGGIIIWQDGQIEVLDAAEFSANQRTHGSIQFP